MTHGLRPTRLLVAVAGAALALGAASWALAPRPHSVSAVPTTVHLVTGPNTVGASGTTVPSLQNQPTTQVQSSTGPDTETPDVGEKQGAEASEPAEAPGAPQVGHDDGPGNVDHQATGEE